MNSGAKVFTANEVKFDRKAFTVIFSILSLLFGMGLGLGISMIEFTDGSDMYLQLALSFIPAVFAWSYALFYYLKRF